MACCETAVKQNIQTREEREGGSLAGKVSVFSHTFQTTNMGFFLSHYLTQAFFSFFTDKKNVCVKKGNILNAVFT